MQSLQCEILNSFLSQSMHRNVNSAMYKEYTQKIFIQARSRVFKYL